MSDLRGLVTSRQHILSVCYIDITENNTSDVLMKSYRETEDHRCCCIERVLCTEITMLRYELP